MPILPAQLGYKKHVSDHEIWRGHIYIFLLYLFFFLIFASEKGLFCVSFIFLHPKLVAVTCGANSNYFTGYKGTVLNYWQFWVFVAILKSQFTYMYSWLSIIQTFKGNRKKFELSSVKILWKMIWSYRVIVIEGSYRGFKLWGVNCV